jgi:hypothetical protein
MAFFTFLISRRFRMRVKDTSLSSLSRKARAEKWKAHLDAYNESGLTRKEYCRRENINYWTFSDWIKKFKGRHSASPPLTLVKLEPSASSAESPGRGLSFQQSPIRFWVNGYCVEVSSHFSQETLSQLIETLRRH